MRRKYIWTLLTIAALITIYGIVTKKFFFLFFMIPLGFGLFGNKNNEED